MSVKAVVKASRTFTIHSILIGLPQLPAIHMFPKPLLKNNPPFKTLLVNEEEANPNHVKTRSLYSRFLFSSFSWELGMLVFEQSRIWKETPSPTHLPPSCTNGKDSECVAAVLAKDTPVLASLPFTFDDLTELALLSWG